MRFVFIGRFEKVLFVDLVVFDEKEKALDYYQKVLHDNENGYNQIELLEQTATYYYNIIEKNVI